MPGSFAAWDSFFQKMFFLKEQLVHTKLAPMAPSIAAGVLERAYVEAEWAAEVSPEE